MRIVDVSAAAGIGLVTVAALVVWSPYPYVEGSRQYSRQASLQDYLTTIALAKGIPWFQNSNVVALCDSLTRYSNSSIVISADIGGEPCGPWPKGATYHSSLAIVAGNRSVSLQAWQVAGA